MAKKTKVEINRATLSISELADAILAVGATNTILARGEPGIGKSSVLKEIVARTGDEYQIVYIDCAQLDLGDFALPYVESVSGASGVVEKITRFAPNARFGFQTGKKLLIMLDELGKAMRAVQNVLLTLLQEGRIGEWYVPYGSIVFATTNLAGDAVGDRMEAHAINRVTVVDIRKPTVEEWCGWAIDAGVSPEVLAFVEAFPEVFDSYTNYAAGDVIDNPRIFNPRKPGGEAFTTPRSLEAASNIIKRRAAANGGVGLSANVVQTLLAGAVGAATAADMAAFVAFGDQMPTWKDIMKKPSTTQVPESPVVRTMLVRRALQILSAPGDVTERRGEVSKWLVFLDRMDAELIALFCISIAKDTKKVSLPWFGGNKCFVEILTKNAWTFA